MLNRLIKGFSFMDSPGYDPTSVTGQVASGCNIVTLHLQQVEAHALAVSHPHQ